MLFKCSNIVQSQTLLRGCLASGMGDLRRVDGRQRRRLLILRIDLSQSRFPSNEARCRLVHVFPPVPTTSYRAGGMLGIERCVPASPLHLVCVFRLPMRSASLGAIPREPLGSPLLAALVDRSRLGFLRGLRGGGALWCHWYLLRWRQTAAVCIL